MEEFQDIEGHEPVETSEPRRPPGAGVPWGAIVATFGLILVVIFAVQNTDNVPVEFLWMSGEFPLSIVILVTAVAAVVFTSISGIIYRRNRLRRKAEKEALKHLRSGD